MGLGRRLRVGQLARHGLEPVDPFLEVSCGDELSPQETKVAAWRSRATGTRALSGLASSNDRNAATAASWSPPPWMFSAAWNARQSSIPASACATSELNVSSYTVVTDRNRSIAAAQSPFAIADRPIWYELSPQRGRRGRHRP